MQKISMTVMASLGGFIAFPSLSWAGAVVGTPAPIVGLGLPALAVGVVGYWLVRKIRDGRTD